MARITYILTAALAGLALATAAIAAPPPVEVVDVTFPSGICQNVDVQQTLQGQVRIILQNSHRVTEVFPNFTVSFSANGRTLSSVGPAVEHITHNPDGSIDKTVVTGLLMAFTVPGYGVIMLDTGYIVFDGEFGASPVILEKGPHQLFGGEADVTAFCGYFEGTL